MGGNRFFANGGSEVGCRIGMATNVDARVAELKSQGEIPKHSSHYTIKKDLTYGQALNLEETKRKECGGHCAGSLGGGYKSGRVWSVYRIDW